MAESNGAKSTTGRKKVPAKKKVKNKTISRKSPSKKRKTGRPALIVEVITRLNRENISQLPIYNLAMLSTFTGVEPRTLARYFAQGKEEAERGIEEWDGRRRKGSRFVQFYRMIMRGRNIAKAAALLTMRTAIADRRDPKYAFKYMAILESDTWAEKQKVDISGKLKTESTISIEELHKMSADYLSNREKDENEG